MRGQQDIPTYNLKENNENSKGSREALGKLMNNFIKWHSKWWPTKVTHEMA